MKPSVWMAVPLNLAPVGPQAFYTSDERLASEWAYNGYDGHQVTVTGMVSVDEARAAIAELIEAAKRGLRNTEALNSAYGSDQLDADADFIRAALARVGGA